MLKKIIHDHESIVRNCMDFLDSGRLTVYIPPLLREMIHRQLDHHIRKDVVFLQFDRREFIEGMYKFIDAINALDIPDREKVKLDKMLGRLLHVGN